MSDKIDENKAVRQCYYSRIVAAGLQPDYRCEKSKKHCGPSTAASCPLYTPFSTDHTKKYGMP